MKIRKKSLDAFGMQSPAGLLDGLPGTMGHVSGDLKDGQSAGNDCGGTGGFVRCHSPRWGE